MNREALEQTIRVLEEVKRRKLDFDMRQFVGYEDEEGNIFAVACPAVGESSKAPKRFYAGLTGIEEDQELLTIPHNCGCTACAAGYAGLDPWFIAQGFRTGPKGYLVYETEDKEELGFDALAAFYGLTGDQCDYLFMPTYERSDDPQLVINRINEVLLQDAFPAELGAIVKGCHHHEDE